MIGSVERFILTPIVLRFARKYIKDAEGAAVSDLRVSISGGSVVFRNFELNLEEIVKDLPCSTVRAFARKLHIKIPWTKLATNPIEVVLDTVECVFAQGKQSSSSSSSTSPQNANAANACTKNPQPDAGEVDGGWIGSLLERALSNITMNVNNIVCKYLFSGHVLTVSCQSAEIFSAGNNWEKAFLELEAGLRKRSVVRNISVSLDKLTADGKVDAYQDPLIRTSTCDVRFAFVSLSKPVQQRCSLDVRLESWDATVSDLQLQVLQEVVPIREKEKEVLVKSTGQLESSQGTSDIPVKQESQSWDSDSSSVDSDSDESPQKKGPVGRVASASVSMIGWAWNFLAEEEVGEKGSEAEDMKEVALRELGAASGKLQMHSNVDWLIQCKLKSGKINCRSDVPSVLSTEKSLSANEQVTLPTTPLLTTNTSQGKLNLGLIGTIFFENPEVYLIYNAGGLQAASIYLNSFTFMQPPNRDTCMLDNTILSLHPSVGEIGDREHHGLDKDGDLSTRFLSAGNFSVHDFVASASTSSLYSETGEYRPLQSQGAVNMTWWQNTTEVGKSQGQNECNAAVKIGVGVIQVQYCPSLMEEWLCWIEHILKENPQGMPSLEGSHIEVPYVSEPASKLLDPLEAGGNQLKSTTGTSDEICAPLPSTDKVFLLFTLSLFQFTIDRITFVLFSADSSNSSSLLILKTSTLCASLRPSQERGSDEKDAHQKAIHISVKDAEIIAGQRCEGMELFQSVVPQFSIHACCGEGGQGSLCGFSGLLVTMDMEGLSFNLNGTDAHVVARVLAAHVPLFCLNVFPPSTFGGIWLGGQVSQITVKVGHFPDSASTGGPSVHIGSCEVQLFGSRVDVFGKDGTVPGLVFNGSDNQPIIEGEDRQAFSGEQCCSSLSVGTVKLYLTNQTLMLMQALHQMNNTLEKQDNSQEDSTLGVVEHKVSSPKRSYFLLVEEVQGHLIALSSSNCPQTVQVWDGQRVSCMSGTHLRLRLVLGGVIELNPQEQSLSSKEFCVMSLHASLRQMEVSLGYIDLSTVLEKGHSMRMCAMRNLGESIICVSGVYCLSKQTHDVISSQQHFPQVISKKLDLDVKDVLLDIPRHHHVWLYEFAKNFYSIQPVQILSSYDPVDCDKQPEMHQNQDKKQSISPQRIKMENSLQIARIYVRLGLWRDGLTESLEGVGWDSSKLIISVEGASMSTLTTKRVKPSHSNSNLGVGTLVPEDKSETSDQRKLRVIQLQVSTSRVQGSNLSEGEALLKRTKQEDSLVHTFPLIQQVVCEEGTESSPILEITWSSGPQGSSTGLMELSPLDWYIDSRFIEEIITVIWERRKHFRPVAGVDVLPVTGNFRIVARAGCLHALPLFSTQGTAELIFNSDYFVGILDNSTGSDARRYLGVHDASTPGVMDPNKLKVQNLDVSLVGWKVAVAGPRFAAPAILIPPADIRVVGKLLGCPGPILLSFTAQSLTVNVCIARLSIALAVLGSLLDGWSATWPLRQCLSSAATTTDDLRSGVFQKSSSQSLYLGKGEINWGDGSDQNRSGSGGWICWRYPYTRSIREVLISEQLFSEVPGLSVDTTAIFQLSFFDQVAGVFVDAAPLLVAREGELKYQIEPFSNVIAEEWRLSWFLPPSGLPTSSSSKVRPLPPMNILKLLQVNRTTTNQPPLGDIPALLPFMLVDLKTEEVRFSLVEGWDDTEAAASQGSQFHVGYHFWSSGLWTLATSGILLAEYTDMATYTHELLLEPVETCLQLSSCSVSAADMKVKAATKDELEPQLCDTSLAPHEVRHPPTVPGYCLWLQTRGKLTLQLQKSILQESSRIGHLLSPGLSPSVPADSESQGGVDSNHLRSRVDKLGQFAFTIENACPIDLAFRQTGSEEWIAITHGGCHQYAWRSPPKLSPLAERKLEICSFSVGANCTLSNGKERIVPDTQKWWCDPIEIEKEGACQRRLLLDPTTAICVVVQAERSQAQHTKVVIRPSFRLTNMTSSVLKIRIRGLFPTKFLDILLTLCPGTNFTGRSYEEAAPVVSEGELFLQVCPSKELSGIEIMFATTLMRQSTKQVMMSVLIEGSEGWSTWAPLEELRASTMLLLKNECVEWKRSGGIVPPSSPLLCLEHRGSEGDFMGQSSVVLWPLFYVQNSLFQSLHLQVGLQGSDVVSQELHHNKETPLSVAMSGRQYLLASITKSEKASDETGMSWIDARGTPDCNPENSSVGEALDNAGLVLAQIRRDEERLKTRPILLTASIFRVGTRFDIAYQELPPVGSHNALTFSSPNTGHAGFSCILRTSIYRDGLPTILISFVPMAVFHNYLPLAMAVRDAWLPPEAPLAAWAPSGEKSAFSLQGLPGQQCGKRICIGTTARDQLQHNFAENCAEPMIEKLEKSTWKEWVWSMPLEVETDSIQEVMVGASNQSFHFLLQTQITSYNVEDVEDGACMCCHLSIYPLMLVSNFSGHSLHFWFRGLSNSSFWDCPDRTKLAPVPASWVNTGTASPKPLVTIGLLISSLRDPMTPVHTLQSALTGGLQQHLEQKISLLGNAKSEPIDSGALEVQKSHEPSSHTHGIDYIWSDCIDLDKITQQSRIMFSLGNNRAHIMMLTYSLVSVHGQTHLLIHRDPQPPFVILNDTEWQLEVRGVQNDSSVLRVMSYAKLECDLTGLDTADSDPFENLDELFLSSTKQEQNKMMEICIRVMGYVWSKPLDVTLQKTTKYEGALDGSVVLSVRVEQLGPTFYVHISPFQEEPEVVLATKFISKVVNITDINIIADIEKLRLSVLDDDLQTLRGPDLSGLSQHRGEREMASVSDEVCFATIEKLSCRVSHHLRMSALPGVPGVSVHKMLLTAALLQVDVQLQESEFPVLITTGVSSSVVQLQQPWKNVVGRQGLSVMFELCKRTDETGACFPLWLQELHVTLMPLTVNIDNASLALGRHLSSSSTQDHSTTSSTMKEKGRQVGDAPDHIREFFLLEPQFHVENFRVQDLEFFVTLRIARPVVVNIHQAPVVLSAFSVTGVKFPLVVLVRGLLAHYATQCVLNAPSVLGSMDILFNVTGLVKSLQAGLNDLLRLPVQGIQHGPHGFLFGLGAGGFSLVRHISVWTFTSLAGFASTLAQVLELTYSDVPSAPPVGSSFSRGWIGLGQGVARGVSGIILTPMRAATGGRSSFLLGVGKGLVGAVAGPVSGALQLVAYTSQGLVGTPGAVSRSSILVEASEMRNSSNEQQSCAALISTRSSQLRFQKQILSGTTERYMAHIDVMSLVYTNGMDQSPRTLRRPVLLLSDRAIRALEDGGSLETVSIFLSGMDIDEDSVNRTLTIYSAEGGSLRERHSSTLSTSKDGLQLYAQLEETAWRKWIPLLRRAVPRSSFPRSK